MAISKISLGLRLFVLVLVIIVNYDACNNRFVAGQIFVETSWVYDVNSTSPCSIEQLDPIGTGQGMIFHGNPYMTCSINISLAQSDVFLDISFHQVGINESLLLYVERLWDPVECSNKFVLIEGQLGCQAQFRHTDLSLDLQGNGSVVLRETTELYPPCPEMIDETGNMMPGCLKVKGFDEKIECAASWDPGLCTPNWDPTCNASLSNRQLLFECDNEDLNTIAMLFYRDYDITTLAFGSTKIRNLDVTAFESFEYLKRLELEDNLLETLKVGVFSPLKHLRVLDLHKNYISTLESGVFHDLHRLVKLALYENQLVALDADLIRGLSLLTYFDVDENILSALPVGMFLEQSSMDKLYLQRNDLVELNATVFRGLGSLRLLALTDNKLKHLPVTLFSGMNFLGMLILTENEIVALDSMIFKGLPYLFRLDLDFNMISSLPGDVFTGNPRLQNLYLDHNDLETLNVSTFKNLYFLQLLTLHYTKLKSIPDGLFSDLTSLKELSLQHNELGYLTWDMFIGVTNLDGSLHLGNNKIVDMNGQVFRNLSLVIDLSLYQNQLSILSGKPFIGLHSLEVLILGENQLLSIDSDTFEGLSNLEYLDIAFNLLLTLSDGVFQSLTNLNKLLLSHNQFETMDSKTFLGLDNVIEMTLYQNGLVSIDAELFKGLGQLYTLTLNENNLTTLPRAGAFSGLISLNALYLDRNQLRSLTSGVFYGMTNLRGLFLYDNNLVQLPNGVFYGLDNLIALFLQTNQLTVLGGHVFEGLRQLKYIFLTVNQLEEVDEDMFQDVTNLTILELNQNKLTDIPNLAQFTGLELLTIRDNPLTMTTRKSFVGLRSSAELKVIVNQHEVCQCFVPKGVNCNAASDRSPYMTCDRLLSDRVLMSMMWVIGINAFAGNIYVMFWRVKNTQKNKVQDLLLGNLAMSDLLMGIYMLIIASADAYFGENFPMQSEAWRSGITCKVAGAISITSSEASVFFVTLISIDRYINIRFPYTTKKMNKTVTLVAITLTWCFAIVFGVVPSVLSGRWFEFYDNSHVCIGLPLALIEKYSPVVEIKDYVFLDEIDWFFLPQERFEVKELGPANGLYFSVALFLGLNCMCYLVIMFCYIEIVRSVRQSSKQSGRSRDMIEEIRLTTKVTAIVATDFCCWFPVIILGILVQTRAFPLPPSVFAWTVTFVLPINSAINPYMYTFADIVSNYRKKQNDKRKQQQRVAQHNMLQQAPNEMNIHPPSLP